ncbi:serine/threonine-protein kinase [Nocardiopsis mangrovi]|uniref:non-specific serine/threonine protein kinase n=1 Tax=Nocardiopsis mangrovi TaxID=1179818 RepID=A0ABV9E1F9_9ACTN
MSTEQSDPGRLLARRYRLTEPIGEGGMGRVWQGVDELLDRPVAIKELSIPPHLPQHEIDVLRTRMLREAHSAAQLSHPSIITVYDVVETDDRPWIVMELVRGPSLGDLLKRDGTMPPERTAKIGLQVAAALAVAHDRGIVHRDIKPGNVLIAGNDRAVLTDFGIARIEGTTNLTRTGLLVGSPGYLAPEQAHGKKASPATDMWSLGVTLYQAVQGVTPFGRDTPVATLTAIVTEDVPPPDAAGPLRPLLERLLDKEPENRPTVHEAARMLHEVSAATGTKAKKKEKREKKARAVAPAPARDSGSARAAAAPPAPPRPSGAAAPAGAAPRDRSGRSRRSVAPLVIAAALAMALAIGAGFWLGVRGGTEAEQTGAETPDVPGTAEAGADASASPSQDGPDAEPEPEDGGGDDAPAADRYEDETGFALDLPEGWEPDRRQGTSVFFDIPGGGYLQIDQTDQPGDNAKDDWERQEGAISGNFGGYDLEGISELDADYLDRYISAADWEFTYDGSDGRMHAVNRAFHTEEKGYALFLVSPEADWDRNRALLDPMTESFEPAA